MAAKQKMSRRERCQLRKARNERGKEEKRIEAEERNSYYAGLSPQEKLARLNQRLGKGKGAKKERAKLKALIEGEK